MAKMQREHEYIYMDVNVYWKCQNSLIPFFGGMLCIVKWP